MKIELIMNGQSRKKLSIRNPFKIVYKINAKLKENFYIKKEEKARKSRKLLIQEENDSFN